MAILTDESLFQKYFAKRIEPLYSARVELFQFVKISKTNQPLGSYILEITPNQSNIVFSLVNQGRAAVSIPIKQNFALSSSSKDWTVSHGNKQWVLVFRDEKDKIRGEIVMGLLLSYQGDNSVSYYQIQNSPDLLKAENEKKLEIKEGDKILINCLCMNFSNFPYLDNIALNWNEKSMILSKQNMAKGLVDGIVGTRCGISRVIYVPESLSESEKKNQENPVSPMVCHVTITHVKQMDEKNKSQKTEVKAENKQNTAEQSKQNEEKSQNDSSKKVMSTNKIDKVSPTVQENKNVIDVNIIQKQENFVKKVELISSLEEKNSPSKKERAEKETDERIKKLEETMNNLFEKIDENMIINTGNLIKDIESYVTQYNKKQNELETLRKQLRDEKAKQSSNIFSTQQQEKANQFLDDANKKKIALERKLKDTDNTLKQLEKSSVENKDKAKASASRYVKSMMSSVFDIVNEIFDENKRYTGSEVSEELYKLLRKSSFETFSEIDNNPFF